MVEFDIDGQKFTLIRRLTPDELKGINDAYSKIQDLELQAKIDQSKQNELAGHLLYYQNRLLVSTIKKCFGMTQEEIENTGYNTLKQLYRELYEYCSKYQ